MFATAIAFMLKNPVVRKATIALAVVMAILYLNKLSANRAFEQGKSEGARTAWIEAEKRNAEQWAEIRKDLDKQYTYIATKKQEISAERKKFDVEAAAAKVRREAVIAQAASTVAEAERALAAAPNENDGLPPKKVVFDTLVKYKDAYEAAKGEVIYLEKERERYSNEISEEINLLTDEMSVLRKDLKETAVERDFYKEAFKNTSKKHGFWHKIKRIATFGIAR